MASDGGELLKWETNTPHSIWHGELRNWGWPGRSASNAICPYPCQKSYSRRIEFQVAREGRQWQWKLEFVSSSSSPAPHSPFLPGNLDALPKGWRLNRRRGGMEVQWKIDGEDSVKVLWKSSKGPEESRDPWIPNILKYDELWCYGELCVVKEMERGSR